VDTVSSIPPRAGDILEDHRRRAGLSKAAVARRMGTSRAQYDRVTRDARPTVDALTKAAEAVGITDTAPLLRSAGYDPGLVAATRRNQSAAPVEPVIRLAG
jgi:transcriptional regulator with XRE-family HTH domain